MNDGTDKPGSGDNRSAERSIQGVGSLNREGREGFVQHKAQDHGRPRTDTPTTHINNPNREARELQGRTSDAHTRRQEPRDTGQSQRREERNAKNASEQIAQARQLIESRQSEEAQAQARHAVDTAGTQTRIEQARELIEGRRSEESSEKRIERARDLIDGGRDDRARTDFQRDAQRDLKNLSNAALMERVKYLDLEVMSGRRDGGTGDHMKALERWAKAETCLIISEILEDRITKASISDDGLPELEGVEWNPDSPLAGVLEDLAPFGNRDQWAAIGRPGQNYQTQLHQADDTNQARLSSHDDHPHLEEPGARSGTHPSDPSYEFTSVARQMRQGGEEGEALATRAGANDEDHKSTLPIAPISEIALHMIVEIAEKSIIVSAGAALGASVVMGYELLSTLQEAQERQEHASENLGMRLGIIATDLIANGTAVPQLSETTLKQQILESPSLASQWNSQISYAGSVNPKHITDAIHRGLRRVVDATDQSVNAGAHAYREAKRRSQSLNTPSELTTGEWSEIRRSVYRNMAEAFRNAWSARER